MGKCDQEFTPFHLNNSEKRKQIFLFIVLECPLWDTLYILLLVAKQAFKNCYCIEI